MRRRSRHDELRKVADGSEALYGGRGLSKDIFFGCGKLHGASPLFVVVVVALLNNSLRRFSEKHFW
jgi:hypothetical protein